MSTEPQLSRVENGNRSANHDMNQLGRRIQELVGQIESLQNPAARALVQECMESLLGFYGQGLARILEIIEQRADADKQRLREALANDGIVRGLLLIHDLHPQTLETRLHEALEKVRPYMESHGGDVELVSLENDFAKLRLQGHCKTCPSSAVTLELAVRQAIEEACPDLLGFEVEGAPAQKTSFTHQPNAAPMWTDIQYAEQLSNGSLMATHIADTPLVICKVGAQLYAYRDHCPACNLPLHLGALNGSVLSCNAGHRYDVQHAGCSLENSSLHLEPLPLLVNDGSVKVAVETPALAGAS